MTEMVERVARAIYETMPEPGVPWSEAPWYTRARCVECASAAIAAMREPTEAMWDAVGRHQIPISWKEWRWVIDAALGEER